MTFDDFRTRYDRYAGNYRLPDGSFPEGIAKKYAHTAEVVEYASQIASGESFPEEDTFLASLSALFHDLYRFEEVRKFGTYDDKAAGIDHGHEGARLLWSERFLEGLEPGEMLAVTEAVELHNKRVVPWNAVSSLAERSVRTVRDADKISILDIVYGFLSGRDHLEDKNLIALGRPEAGITPEILESAIAGRPISYSDMRSKEDFVVTLFSWTADLNFAQSAKILLKNGIYCKLASLLPKSEKVEELIFNNEERLKCLSLKYKI